MSLGSSELWWLLVVTAGGEIQQPDGIRCLFLLLETQYCVISAISCANSSCKHPACSSPSPQWMVAGERWQRTWCGELQSGTGQTCTIACNPDSYVQAKQRLSCDLSVNFLRWWATGWEDMASCCTAGRLEWRSGRISLWRWWPSTRTGYPERYPEMECPSLEMFKRCVDVALTDMVKCETQ